jgi:Undecaprenyl-phosphate glucose phosphotransferase
VSEPFIKYSILDDVTPDFYLGAGKSGVQPSQVASLSMVTATVMTIEFMFFMTLAVLGVRQWQAGHALADNGLIPALALTLLLLNLFSAAKLYRIEVIGRFDLFCRHFAGVMIVLLAAALCGAMFLRICDPAQVNQVPVGLLAAGGALSLGCMIGFRYLCTEAFRFCVERGFVSHNVVVLGTTELAKKFIDRVQAQKLGVRVTAVFDHEILPSAQGSQPGGVPAGVTELLRYSKRNAIDTVVIALPVIYAPDLDALVRQLEVQPLRIRLLPYCWDRHTRSGGCAPAGEVPGMTLLAVSDPPISGLNRMLKSGLDVVAASLALLLFGPLMLICAAGIKMSSPGPVLFRQKRIGYRNTEFSVYKFRTMHAAACNTGRLTERNDPRVFEFGRLLRKLSLDELPQLLNVLKGDMSLVGPRPHMPEARAAGMYYHRAVADYAARHRVKPGITGLAQVSGWRGPTETIEQIERRVEHDLKYIQEWSLFLDIKILMKTALVGFFGKNAF